MTKRKKRGFGSVGGKLEQRISFVSSCLNSYNYKERLMLRWRTKGFTGVSVKNNLQVERPDKKKLAPRVPGDAL